MLRRLIEVEGITYKHAGALMDITKNAAIGRGTRMGLVSRNAPVASRTKGPVTTLPERMAALEMFPPRSCCVYPIGHVGKPGFRFCRTPTHEHAYCDEHRRVTMRPPGLMAAE